MLFEGAEKKREQVTKKVSNSIKLFYESLAKELEREIARMEKDKRYKELGKKSMFKSIRAQIEKQLESFNNELNSEIIAAMDETINELLKENHELLLSMNMPGVVAAKVSFAQLKPDIIESIIDGKLYDGKWKLSTKIWGDSKEVLKDIDTIIAKGITLNKSSLQIAQELEKYVKPTAKKPWNWSKVYPGSRKIVDYNAQRLARTMVSHAYQESFVKITELNPFIDAYRWLISNSHRVCEICIDRAETDKYGLGAGVFPKDKLPIDHPNGMCTFEAMITKTQKEMTNDLASYVAGGSSKMDKDIKIFADYLKKTS